MKKSLDQKLQELNKAKNNLVKQTECFHNILKDRSKISDEDYDSYCEEMQYAMEREEDAEKDLGYY